MRRAVALPVTITAAAAVLASAALAQDTEIGSRIKPRQFNTVEHSHENGVLFAQATIRCAVRTNPGAARNYLAASTAADVARWNKGLFGRELSCGDTSALGVVPLADSTSINISTDLKRGMIAEVLLRSMKSALPAAEPIQHFYRNEWQAASTRDAAVDEMAICVAFTNPGGIEALLATTPEAPAEMTAISALSPSLGSCLSANARMSANRESLRAALAEALYHRVAASQASNAAVAAVQPSTHAAPTRK